MPVTEERTGGGPALAAVDLGATSGRVVVGRIASGRLTMEQVARFPNTPVLFTEGHSTEGHSTEGHSTEGLSTEGEGAEGLHWNIQALYGAVEEGLGAALRSAPGLCSVGIDSWAVDYALLRGGRMLGVPYHYRDARSARGVELVHAEADGAELFTRNGLQHLDFNTLFQLAAERESGFLDLADRLLLLPDLLAYWLTGQARAEATNASTTGLLSVADRTWDTELMERLGYPPGLFADLVGPGERIGPLTAGVAGRLGADRGRVQVTAVGSHDTASAVAAVPFETPDAAYISSGTWSLVGLELDAPVLTPEARAANFTNEGGVDGRVRFLRNVSGLWLLSESVRTWRESDRRPGAARGGGADLQELLDEAAKVEREVPVFDAADERFVPPGDMPARIRDWCGERGIRPPESRAEVVRSILESLAAAYARTIDAAEELSGRKARTVHVVGGGSRNALLCRLTARRTGRRVVAGPVEATAIGNLLVQARAAGLVSPEATLEDLRAIVRASFPVTVYEP
ncbi:rhamnulokinase [Nocardiopsis suaedae]|uniref:Rhamnulokinase n=1 Tax=Nocardiopsis suaedae TaxID=3018444 RepID=A0ABT4THN3_9ACTN|nr:rhamnulokinase family protein [Nocardiopsis suaedae]MDA2804209.1 rhamnulokinase [Nocardiopsis suaedae]